MVLLFQKNQIKISRFLRGLKSAMEGRVKKYIFVPSGIIRWVVTGEKSDYLTIENRFCLCEDFFLNGVIKRKIPACYHLFAIQLAKTLDTFQEFKINDKDYDFYINEWLLL